MKRVGRGGGRKEHRQSRKTRVTPLPIMSGSFKKLSSICFEEE